MRLDGGGLRSFDLRLVGYEFPGAQPKTLHDEDANWLVVEGIVDDGERYWTFQEPCFLTWEVDQLADWLEALADGRGVDDRLSFTEPVLAFARIDRGDGAVLRVAFDHEARPLWRSPRDGASEDEPVVLEFDGAADALRTAAEDLRQQLERSPVRGEAPSTAPATVHAGRGVAALFHGMAVLGGDVLTRTDTLLRSTVPD